MSERLIKVEMTYEREDGSRYRRTISNDEAIRWKRFTDGVCVLAQVRGGNPDWRSIKWDEEELEVNRERF